MSKRQAIESDEAQQRDALLLRLLKTPPQPRPKRERVAKKAAPAAKKPARRVKAS
jgi:hypothetical protein